MIQRSQAGHCRLLGFQYHPNPSYTTAQDGRATPELIAGYIAAAEQGKLTIDVAAYMGYPMNDAAVKQMHGPYAGRQYTSRLRIAGTKINLDGSPQGKTACLTEPYFEPPPGQVPCYRGYQNMPNEKAVGYVEESFRNGWQVPAHVNGDAALDQYLNAVEDAARRVPGKDRRAVAIHAQVTRADQLDRMKALEVIPSFFSLHTFYWGDWHRDSVLGPERAANISPAASWKPSRPSSARGARKVSRPGCGTGGRGGLIPANSGIADNTRHSLRDAFVSIARNSHTAGTILRQFGRGTSRSR